MRMHLVRMLGVALLLGVAGSSHAAEATAIVDRSTLPLGEDFRVKVIVRKCVGRPHVQPPSVPGCRIELLGMTQAGGAATLRSPSGGGRRPSTTDIPSLIEAIEKMEADALRSLGQQAGGGRVFDQSAFDMLRSTRQQALNALQQGPSGAEYHVVFRLTPERAGILTLPSFIIDVDGRTLLTKPIEVTVEDKQQAAAPPATPDPGPKASKSPGVAGGADGNSQAARLPRPFARAELMGVQTSPVAYWPWLSAVLLVPVALLGLIASARSWLRLRELTAPQRAQRQAACAARRTLHSQLQDGASPDAISKALMEYLRGKFNLPAGEITPFEASRELEARSIPPELAERVGNFLGACSEVRFAPGGVAVQESELVAEARALIQQLDRQGRN